MDRNPGDQPALVNLAVTRGRPDRAAYVATILDLTARDYLMLTEPQPGYLICALAPASRPISSLPLSERIVASNARIRLAGLGSAPLAVLTEACSADQATYWDPFEEALKGEARRCGVTQPRLPTAVTRVLQAVAAAAGVLTFLAVHARHPGLWYPLISGFIVFVLPASWVAAVRRTPRLSRAGAALAAQWRGAFANDPVAVSYAAGAWSGPAVQRLAYAVAVGIPVPGIQVPGPGSPSAAWSSRTGDWRLVPIEPPSGKRGHRLAQPGLTQFDGQVIARWMTHSSPEDEEISTWSIVVDDGGRGRSFDVRPDVYGQVRLGDLVGVRVDPRSMKLLELTPARRSADELVAAEEQAGLWRRPAAGRLLTAEEASEALGRPVRSTTVAALAASEVIYRGSGVTVIVTVADGALGGLSSGPARRFGRSLPGLGDEAWILNRDRTVVVRVGTLTAKITINDRGPLDTYGVLNGLAAVLAARLAEHVSGRADDAAEHRPPTPGAPWMGAPWD